MDLMKQAGWQNTGGGGFLNMPYIMERICVQFVPEGILAAGPALLLDLAAEVGHAGAVPRVVRVLPSVLF